MIYAEMGFNKYQDLCWNGF